MNLFEKLNINIGETEKKQKAGLIFGKWVQVEDSEEGRFALACSLMYDTEDNQER